jgi:hypothetical protein
LWPWRLARGKLTILDGDPGVGKSHVTLDLAARLSWGQPWPDGAPSRIGPANTIVLNGEDGAQDTVRERLRLLGADLERVYILPPGPELGQAVGFPAQAYRLGATIAQFQASLVVIDPIVSFLSEGISTGNDQSVRRALLPLAQVAEQHDCAILMVRHLNKSGSRRSLYRGGGSIGIIGMCRCGWLIAEEPGGAPPQQRYVLAQTKNNLGPIQPSVAYELKKQEKEDGGLGALTWLGTSPLSADQLLGRFEPAKRPAPRAQASDFLNEFLAQGPRTSREIWEAAQPLGLTERTLSRAKQLLCVRSVRVWADGKRLSYWLLPTQELPKSATSAKEDEYSLEPWLAPLRAKYPVPTPLDEM